MLFNTMLKLTSKYGDRFVLKMLNTRVLHTSSPHDVEILLSHSRNITKSTPYTFLESWLGTGLLLSSGNKWHKRRKILTPTFHFNILKSFYVVMEEKSRNLVEVLRQTQGRDVDLLPVLSDFTLYTICETAMGTQLDMDKSAASLEYKNNIMKIGNLLLSRLTRIWLHNDLLYKMSPIGKQFTKCLNIVHSFADNVIANRRRQKMTSTDEVDPEGMKKRMAMLDLLLEAQDKEEIDLEGIREEVNTFMFEGHDTTAIALTFCLMLIADHEDVQERIYEECRQLLDKCEGRPGMSDFSHMRYLDAVIKESLRLYPSVPFIGRRIDEDFYIDDLLVKKDTQVSIHIYSLQRREDLYSEPQLFRPERFLDGEVKHQYGFVPFSAGPRNCIGQRFAMLEMKCALSAIVKEFKLEPRVRSWRPGLASTMILRPLEPVYVRFIPRH
ncbi:hypothetical protein O3G_MSEX007459 [Manduca sexta]|nr:hypothetical protein O3G_MSEX007459 [Manduca sexta]KAG6452049.1 hypothetical protein O3G_MSEX007459 [Manduca sexta]